MRRIPPSPPQALFKTMSYQVLALKYRPQTFDEVVGQPHVTTTLSNAISTGRVAHAILFTGPRGTGKTTIARILAKAMNCSNGPLVTPCNQCKICKDIIDGHCTDVFEIDGASNNSVDQIRDLRENVTYMPSSATYKIYIIDEVHMLSTAAFNALLKTLEEPPEHVMFIFATTEVHKIPATILSRCQRHDLGRVYLNLISDHLQTICQSEGFELTPQSLDLIAQEADGSIRDSLSLLDRILSATETKTIEHTRILSILGVLDRQIMFDLSDAVIKKNGVALIDLIERINDSGQDLKKFYADIITHFRNLTIVKLCGQQSTIANITESEKQKLHDAGVHLTTGYINSILQGLLNEESLVNYSSHTKISIEMVLLKMMNMNPGAQIDQIISNLTVLSNQIQDKFPNNVTPSQPLRPNDSKQPLATNLNPSASRTPNYPVQGKTVPVNYDAPPNVPGLENAPGLKNRPELENIPNVKNKQSLSMDPVSVNQQGIEKNWDGFLKKIQPSFPFMFALLSKGRVNENDKNKIVVELTDCTSFDVKRINGKKQELVAACNTFLNKPLEISILSQTKTFKQDPQKKDAKKARQAAFNHPLVVEAQKMFDGKIINQ